MASDPVTRPWWRQGLSQGVFLLTVLALISMARVRGTGWVVAPMGLCLVGCLLYRRFRRILFPGVEVLLVVAYFVGIGFLRPHLETSGRTVTALDGLSIVGLVILYPAQMALWTGRRTLQELVLLGLVALSQFLYGMTLARPTSWWLGVIFIPILVYTLLQYATAREIESVKIRPERPRGFSLRLGGLALLLMPFVAVIGGGVFYLLPRYSTITEAFDLLQPQAGEIPDGSDPSEVDSPRRGTPRSGPGRAMDLLVAGDIVLDYRPVLSARIWLDMHDRYLPPEYGGRLYLRRQVLDDYQEKLWTVSGSHRPRIHVPDEQGQIRLPGPPPRDKMGFTLEVTPRSRTGREQVVGLGRPTRVRGGRRLEGHPEERLRFVPRLRRSQSYTVSGEMIFAWEQLRTVVRKHGLSASHPELDHYIHVPDRPRGEEVRKLARDLTRDARDDVDRIDRLLHHVRSFRYSLHLPRVRLRENPTADFLLRSKTGHCERFADGLAALCRHLGIPARVVKGFKGGEWHERPVPGFRFLARDAHAWVEVHFDRIGWVALDPSPQGELANLGLTPPLDSLLGDPPPVEPDAPAIAFEPDIFTGTEQLSLYQHLLSKIRPIVEALGWPMIGLLLAGGAALILLLRRTLRDREGGAEEAPDPDGSTLFNPILEFYTVLSRRGIRPGRGETPLELARRAEARLETRLVPVMERMYAARFGNMPFSDAERNAFAQWLEWLARPPAEEE